MPASHTHSWCCGAMCAPAASMKQAAATASSTCSRKQGCHLSPHPQCLNSRCAPRRSPAFQRCRRKAWLVGTLSARAASCPTHAPLSPPLMLSPFASGELWDGLPCGWAWCKQWPCNIEGTGSNGQSVTTQGSDSDRCAAVVHTAGLHQPTPAAGRARPHYAAAALLTLRAPMLRRLTDCRAVTVFANGAQARHALGRLWCRAAAQHERQIDSGITCPVHPQWPNVCPSCLVQAPTVVQSPLLCSSRAPWPPATRFSPLRCTRCSR